MPITQPATKEKILAAAEGVFHENGFKGARTTLIAKRAGISRTMLHYHYKTKEALFEAVVQQSFGHFIKHAQALFQKKYDLRELIEEMVDMIHVVMEEKPGMASFIVNIMNESPTLLTNMAFVQEEMLPVLFDQLLANERKYGSISNDITGENLLLNIYGLCVIPFLGTPIIKFKEQRSTEEMKTFIEDRKEMIKDFIWKGIQA